MPDICPTPVLLPGKSHGWRSLVGCSPWSHEESDMTERLPFHFPLSCLGEGNGNPLQCSCLENPRDGRAWWAAVYGVTHSWTQLKWLSSSKSWDSLPSLALETLEVCGCELSNELQMKQWDKEKEIPLTFLCFHLYSSRQRETGLWLHFWIWCFYPCHLQQ